MEDNSCEFYQLTSQKCKTNANAGSSERVAFSVDWKASDDTGLTTVTVTLEDDEGNVIQTTSASVSGTNASGTDTLSKVGDYGEDYTIVITATDTNSQSSTTEETHTADGTTDGDAEDDG
ncbi:MULTISPECIES: hypothetical protein [Salinibaculum]|uniref:hypothetical protein n=1 Tax=Salinibaculum TaxID=2732368 RepID=UPI0030CBD886